MTPVHLRLLAGRRLESSHRHHLRRLSLRLQPVLQNRAAAGIVAFPQFPQQYLCVPHSGLQPLIQIRLEWLQLACRCRPCPYTGLSVFSRYFANRLAVIASQFTDRLMLSPCLFSSSIFCTSPPRNKVGSSSQVRVGPFYLSHEGGEFSIGDLGILQPAVTLEHRDLGGRPEMYAVFRVCGHSFAFSCWHTKLNTCVAFSRASDASSRGISRQSSA